MTQQAPRILVVAESASDAALISEQVRHPRSSISSCLQSDGLVHDFERIRPHVLVLAFKSLASAQSHCGALRQSPPRADAAPYRTVLLCEIHDAAAAFELCRDGLFDDYVPFWPLVHDACRLAMSVQLALRALEGQHAIDTLHRMATHGTALSEMDGLLDEQIAHAGRLCDHGQAARHVAEATVDDVLDAFIERTLTTGLAHAVEVRDAAHLKDEITHLGTRSLKPLIRMVGDAQAPMRQWVGALKGELERPLQAARSVGRHAAAQRPQVLLVDDDAFIGKILSQILGQANIGVYCVSSGAQARAALRTRCPDLILMDVGLPDIDGIELTRQLKREAPYDAIPVIMLTGHSEKQVIVSSLAAGASDFIVKPIDRDLLLRKVARHTGWLA